MAKADYHRFLEPLVLGIISGVIATLLYTIVVYPIISQKPNILVLCTGAPIPIANGSIIYQTQIDIINRGSGVSNYFDMKLISYGVIAGYQFNQEPVTFRVNDNTTKPYGHSMELTSLTPIWPNSHTVLTINNTGSPGLSYISLSTDSPSYYIANSSNYYVPPFYKGINLTGKCG